MKTDALKGQGEMQGLGHRDYDVDTHFIVSEKPRCPNPSPRS